MSRLSVFGGALLVSTAITGLAVSAAWAQDDAYMKGEGLYRESDGAGHHMGWTHDGPEGARGQARRLRLCRSEERRGRAASATARRKRRR